MSEARLMRIINPATEEVIAELESDDSRSIIEKFNRAMAAQLDWRKSDLDERAAVLTRFRDLLEEKRDLLARTLTEEVGKPIAQSRAEISATLERVDFFLDHFRGVLQEEIVLPRDQAADGKTEERLSHDPLGVIANISAWNYPFFVGVNVFAPAILTGNAVLYKPSEFASLTGLGIAELLSEAGLPDDVFLPVLGEGFAGQELLKWPVHGVFFTGSYNTGRRIADVVARRLTRMQLELGGKDPIYVCDDVNIQEAAAAVADGAFYNNGQSCCAVERVYVHAGVYKQFVEAFVETVRSYKMGDPLQEDVYLGPLAREAQIPVLLDQIHDAQRQGAELLLGGDREASMQRGHYFQPTVFTNVDHSMQIMRDESFGPVIGIMQADNDRQALQLMNDTSYGLTAGVFTNNEARARKILTELEAGSVYWNCSDRVSPRLPWSGRNHSGIGVTLGLEGIRSFVKPRAWHLRKLL